MNLDTKVDIGGGLKRAFQGVKTSIKKVFTRKPKVPSSDEPLSNYRYYETYKKEITRDPTLPAVRTDEVVDAAILSGYVLYPNMFASAEAPKPPLPWFLSGVPEQYHKHYTEWQIKQPSGSPYDFGTYLSVTGQYPVYMSGLGLNYGSTYSRQRSNWS